MIPKHEISIKPWANTGPGPNLAVVSIDHPSRLAVIEPESAFWALVDKSDLEKCLAGEFVAELVAKQTEMGDEMHMLRFGLRPSAVYFNPTDRCNFNCSYCYLPESMRRNGRQMSPDQLCRALEILSAFFKTIHTADSFRPQLIFHGSEPMMAREAIFAGIEAFDDYFDFGLQTNATLLDDKSLGFLTEHQVAIGISLDGPSASQADATRHTWKGQGYFDRVVGIMDSLASYGRFNVITTVTTVNVEILTEMIDFYHEHEVQVVMLNPVRCTRKGGRDLKPADHVLSENFIKALDRTWKLYQETGRKLVVSNFANILAAILGPTSRRLMCDISPCGGGRCFFAVAANGDIFPCSEFIGMNEFKGGNLFENRLENVLKSTSFKSITGRIVENIVPCRSCAIKHFCGAPCPAEINAVFGSLEAPAPYCEFYQRQVRYAFSLVARDRQAGFLWDDWDQNTEQILNLSR